MRRALAVMALGAGLAGCGTRPPVPDWQVEARGAIERYQQAYLAGATRAAEAEFARARSALASTGDAARVAQAELVRCALQVASVAGDGCTGFEALRADTDASQRAYADHLAGRALSAQQVALLPPAQQLMARHLAAPAGAQAADLQALQAIADPLSRLVAAGVALRAGRASPQALELAAETASAQGWRRPLLAWLGAQAQRAQQAGDEALAQRLRRRMSLVTGP